MPAVDRYSRPETQVFACARVPVSLVRDIVPDYFLTSLERNQKLASCCRRTEGHLIEAWYCDQPNADRGIPDIYIITCTECGREHKRFCVGGSIGSGPLIVVEPRPIWVYVDGGVVEAEQRSINWPPPYPPPPRLQEVAAERWPEWR